MYILKEEEEDSPNEKNQPTQRRSTKN